MHMAKTTGHDAFLLVPPHCRERQLEGSQTFGLMIKIMHSMNYVILENAEQFSRQHCQALSDFPVAAVATPENQEQAPTNKPLGNKPLYT